MRHSQSSQYKRGLLAPACGDGKRAICCGAVLQRDDVVGRVARERAVEIGDAAYLHPLDRVAWRAVARLALGQAALQRALVAGHPADALFAGDLAPLTNTACRAR
jgi:hypothetical protein